MPSSTASSSNNDNVLVNPSPVKVLYRHALESIFAFLDSFEIVSVLQVSKNWLAAVSSMACLDWEDPNLSAPLSMVAKSVLVRHLIGIGSVDTRTQLNADTLFIIAEHMSHLQTVVCTLALPDIPAFRFTAFPSSLTTVDVKMCPSMTAASVDIALRALGRLSQLQVLSLKLLHGIEHISFSPLVGLPQLHSLTIDWQDETELTVMQMFEIRTMQHLRIVSMSHMTTNMLRTLLHKPHKLQWEKFTIPLSTPLTDDGAALLPQLPSLTAADFWVSCARFDWFHLLPHITCVDLGFEFSEPVGDEWTDSLVSGLQRCVNIEILKLAHCPNFKSFHLTQLLPRLPRLQELSLINVPIDSLSFLDQQPVKLQLSSFRLIDCSLPPINDLRYLHALQGLRFLSIQSSMAAPLDEYTRWLLSPPSVALPMLHRFLYTPP